MILDRCIEDRFIVNASVGNCRIGPGYFKVLDTVCDTAERQRLLYVCEDAVGPFFIVYQCRDAELSAVIKSETRRDLRDRLDSADVHRLLDCLADCHLASVGLAPPVMDLSAVCVFKRFILDIGAQIVVLCIKSRCIGRQDLEAGTGLAHRVSRAVVTSVSRFGTASADDRLDLAGLLIHNDNR